LSHHRQLGNEVVFTLAAPLQRNDEGRVTRVQDR